MRATLCLWFCVLFAPMAYSGTLAPATGGEDIPESTAGGAYTDFDGPVYEEDNARDVGEGSIILSLPPDFEWDTGSQPRIRVESLGGGGQNINRVPDGGTFQATAVSASEIQFDINRSTRGQRTNRLTFENLRVRPVEGASGAAGEIAHTGDAEIDSVDAGTTSWGSLSMEGASGGGGNVVLAANGETQGPVTVVVNEDVDLTVAGSNCPSADQWRYQWDIDGDADTSATQGQSPCDQLFSRTESFDSTGTVPVSVEAEYRQCLLPFFGFCFGWGDWQSHGEDSLDLDVTEPSQCYTDNFQRSELGDDWVTAVSSGEFTPGIVDGRLRMTEAISEQATAATVQREIPGADNLVVLEFDYYAYGGTGADGLAVVLSDASVPASPGGYGGSLGYANRSGVDGFAGGWLGVGLDEFGNFSNATEGRNGGPGFVPEAVALRGSGSSQTGYEYLGGTDTLTPGVDATGSDDPHRYRITVDSREPDKAEVTIERDTGSGFEELIGPVDVLDQGTGQAPVPENFVLSLTGSTGGSTNVHELGNMELCALELNPVGEQVDHFELRFDETALTCQPLGVDIRACANDDCSELYTDPVDVTLSPDGWVDGNTVTLTNGTGSKAFQRTQPGNVTLGVASSDPPKRPLTDNLCRSGSGPLAPGECEVSFRDSGLAITIPDQTSSRPSGPIAVRAVQRDDETNACVPAFADVEREVDFWSDYIDPDASGRPASRSVRIEGEEIGRAESDATPVTLAFDDNGTAEIELLYPDAGLMGLNARYEGAADSGDEGLQMDLLGDSQWVSVPQGFCVETGFECEAADASCPAAQVAAETFDLSVTAVGWQDGGNEDLCSGNPPTPNFELADIPLSSELLAPADGVEGELSLSDYSHAPSADAQVTVQQGISEVGVFGFRVVPPEGAYFGQTVPSSGSEPSGRVIPERFDVAVTHPGTVDPYCETGAPFAYSGQDLDWMLEPELRITALNAEGQRTRNYTEAGFQRLVPGDVERDTPDSDASAVDRNDDAYPLAVDLETGAFVSQAGGRIDYRFAPEDQLRYVKRPESRVAPFSPEMVFDVRDVTDEDGVSAPGLPESFTPVADFALRYGRLRIDNAYGPETLPLTLPMRAAFWDGDAFALNRDESCWGYNTGNTVSLEPENFTSVAGAEDTLLEGKPMDGSELVLEAPGEGNTGEVRATFGVPIWLQDDFNDDGELENPSGLATFGVYRGHDRIIYWREVQ